MCSEVCLRRCRHHKVPFLVQLLTASLLQDQCSWDVFLHLTTLTKVDSTMLSVNLIREWPLVCFHSTIPFWTTGSSLVCCKLFVSIMASFWDFFVPFSFCPWYFLDLCIQTITCLHVCINITELSIYLPSSILFLLPCSLCWIGNFISFVNDPSSSIYFFVT